MSTPSEQRLQLLRAGFNPLPLSGKLPVLREWQKRQDTSEGDIDIWAKVHASAVNTGILTRSVPCLDIDILNQDAAEAVEQLVRERFEEGGHILVRVGLSPKCGIPFRCDKAFSKINAVMIPPNGGSEEKLEFLADGQQFVAFGIHPKTNRPYSWFGGELGAIKRDDLPYIHEEQARQLVDDAADLLCRDFGYKRAGERPRKDKPNGPTSGALDWAALVENIRKGHALHDSLRDLAGKLVTSGMDGGAATNLLRGLLDKAECEHDDRWKARRDDIPRLVQTAEKPKEAHKPEQLPPLPFIKISDWQDQPVPERPWTVKGRIPASNITLLSGEGSVGKSIISLQLAIATVLGKDWLGVLPESGAVLLVCCEDDRDEVWRRLDLIFAYHGASYSDFEHLHIAPLAGEETLMATADRSGIVKLTRLFQRVCEAACDIRPKLIVLDNAADIFAGNENDRTQVRQFIGHLRGGLAIPSGAGVLLTSHPSLTGIASGSGLSGSTAWNASVRSRLYLKRATVDKNEEPNPDLRILEVMKSNYGPPGETVTLQWRDGLFVPTGSTNEFEQSIANAAADNLFLDLLRRFTKQQRNVSPSRSSTYAPTVFADQSEAKKAKIRAPAFAAAMERLLADDKIKAISEGPESRKRQRIVEAGFVAEIKTSIVGEAAGATCIQCHTSEGTLRKIKRADAVGGKPETLHEACAKKWFEGVWS
jgi:RecA-family ATPase